MGDGGVAGLTVAAPTWTQWWDEVAVLALAAALAAAVGVLLHALVAWAIERLSRRAASPVGTSLAVHARRPAQALFVLGAVQVVLLGAREPERLLEPLRHLVALGLIAAAAWLVVRLTRVVDWGIETYFADEGADALRARRVQTRVRVIHRVIAVSVWVVAGACMLMTFPRAWQMGASLLASAGIVGLVVGIAARPVLANLIAGVQIAMTQPIRLGDVVAIDGQLGWVEEITATYVVMRTRERRRLIVPVTFFVERSFENWTRTRTGVTGAATVIVDRGTDVERVRSALRELLERSGKWDGRVWGLEVSSVLPAGLELRAVMSAADAQTALELQGEVREGLMREVQRG